MLRWLLGAGALTYLVGLVATLPARLIVEPQPGTNIADVAGTVWRGQVSLTSGEVATWRFAPLASLANFGFTVNWRLAGVGSAARGQARLWPGAVALDGVSGTARASLLGVLVPRLPFACDAMIQLDVRHARFGDPLRFEGRVLSDVGQCAPTGSSAPPLPVPALQLTAIPADAGDRLRIARRVPGAPALVEIDSRAARITPEGARLFPFASPPGGISIPLG